jgi:hypothetical protein
MVCYYTARTILTLLAGSNLSLALSICEKRSIPSKPPPIFSTKLLNERASTDLRPIAVRGRKIEIRMHSGL